MEAYDNLRAVIAANVYQNNNNEVTADMVKTAMNEMVASLGAEFQYGGVAEPGDNPGTPDYKVFYLAAQAGTYTNFGGIVLGDGEVAALTWNGTWAKQVVNILSTDGANKRFAALVTPAFTSQKYIKRSDGAISASSSVYYRATEDFTDISCCSRVVAYLPGTPTAGGGATIVFYDAQKRFVSSYYRQDDGITLPHYVDVPANAHYARFGGFSSRDAEWAKVYIGLVVDGAKIGIWETTHEWLAKNTAKVLYTSAPINFDNTVKKVYLPWFGFSNPKAASGRMVIEATEVAYDFSAFTTNAYMLYYNIDTETYSFIATTAPVTERYIPIAAVQISGDTSQNTGRVVSVRWCVAKDARVDGASEITRLASVENGVSYLNVKDKTFMPDFAIFGTIYNGIVNRNSNACLYNPTFIQVQPGSTIRCFHASGVTLRITEYDEDYTYLSNSGTYSDISDYALRAETRYVRISAEYSGYSEQTPITADDFRTGDFGFTYGTSEELDRFNAPIYSFYESPWWIDDVQWRKSNYNYGAIIIPVSGAKKLTMIAGTDVNARVALANTYNPATLSEYDTIDGIGNQGCAPNNTRTLDIPPTCRYIVLSCRYTWSADPAYDANAKPNALPVSLIIDGKEYMKPIEEAVSSVAEKVQSISDTPTGIIGRNITKDAAVRATRTRVNDSEIVPLSFIHLSDIHTKGNNYKCFVNAMQFLQHYDQLKFAIVTGDLVWDHYADPMTWYDLAIAQTTKSVLNVIGNHDAGQQNSTTPSLDYVSSDVQLYNKAIAPYVSSWGVTQPTDAATFGKSYYYKDFVDEKIRLIVLNEFETDYQIDPNNPNKLLYSREYRAMHQAQIDWLIATLGSTPDDYGVVVAYHQPDDNIANDGNPFVSIDLVGRTGWPANIYSETRNWLPRILNAFATKAADSFTFTQTGAVVGTINVSCDFTANQAEFICILNGHTHRDIIGRLTDYPALLILCVGADNLLYTSNFCPRAEGTPSEDLFNVVNIDRNRKTIKIIRIGSDASITGQVRDQLLINY